VTPGVWVEYSDLPTCSECGRRCGILWDRGSEVTVLPCVACEEATAVVAGVETYLRSQS